jgi:hypothetical protein
MDMKRKFLTAAVVTGMLAGSVFAQTAQLKTAPAKKDSVRVASATYICPMDKDVVSSKPGKCPKCGMTLMKVSRPSKDTVSVGSGRK